MRRHINFLFAALFGLAAVACSSPEKMAEMAENVTVKCDPAVLEVIAGEIDATISVTYPEDYFHPKAILEVTPVLVYEGGEIALDAFVFQGEKVEDNYEVVPSTGATITKKVHFDYAPGMESSYIELRGVAKHKDKMIEMPSKKVVDGANTTYMLVDNSGALDYKADSYQEILKETAEGQILYQISSADVRNSELKSQTIQDYQAALQEILENERKTLVSTDVVAYASPDGNEEFNAELSGNRSKSAEEAYNKVTKDLAIEAPVNVESIAEDWEGFQELVAGSDIEDKDLIIRVLSMYSDPAVRETEIKNMSAVYSTLASEVLPELRRARFIANVEYQNYTNEELLTLIEENIDILDEQALLRAATLVKKNEQKAEVYGKAVEKFNGEVAKYNLGVTYIKLGELDKAKDVLASCTKDADWYNAMGVIALRNNELDAASEYFTLAGNASANKNAAVIDILDGEYQAAAAKLAGSTDRNAILAQILVDDYSNVDKLTCKCPKAYYIRAIAAARQGDAEGVKTNLEKAGKDEKLAERAAKDVEFAQYR